MSSITATMKSDVASVEAAGDAAVDRAGEGLLARSVLLLGVGDRLGQVGGERLDDAGPGLRPGDGHVDRVGVLLAVEPPALRAEEVDEVVDLERRRR